MYSKKGLKKPEYLITAQFFGIPISEVTTDNIMATVKTYCDEKNLALYDSMLNYDKNKERKLSRTDFLSAFSVS